ncbi:GIY-YIG nuclease family protein [Kitasatospora sp. NPDC101155]|uniref:GIY-YIG nuclease family protein n=1 Tax=Kitasatospora sp. NPDC101155 TaxID=3364097 RepID=UPI00380D47F0
MNSADIGSGGPGPCRDCDQHSPDRWPGDRCRPCWEKVLAERRARIGFGPTALYRLYDRGGELLYIGITTHPVPRFREHAAEMPWWPEVDEDATAVEWLDCGLSYAAEAEAAAIRDELPLYN